MGNLEGVRLPRLFERKRKSISGSFLGQRGHSDFKSGGPSGTLAQEQGSPELIYFEAQRAHL